MRRVAVICTGGVCLGYGHIMRSLAFQAAAPLDSVCTVFACVESNDRHLFRAARGAVSLHNKESDLGEAVAAHAPDIVVWDTVDCSVGLLRVAKRAAPLHASISPVFRHMAAMDLLFTRNVDAAAIPGVVVYRGYQYAVFGAHCSRISDDTYLASLSREALPVGVSMGGADAPNKTLRIVEGLAAVDRALTVWILLGEGYAHSYEALVGTFRRAPHHEIILAKTSRSLWSVLANCSVAVLAGGLTTVEALYAGLPSFNLFERPEHQVAAGTEMFRRGAALRVGLFDDASLSRLRAIICDHHDDRSRLLAMREKTKGLVDCLAATRIFAELFRAVGACPGGRPQAAGADVAGPATTER